MLDWKKRTPNKFYKIHEFLYAILFIKKIIDEDRFFDAINNNR